MSNQQVSPIDEYFERILANTARLLVKRSLVVAASIVANARAELVYESHDNWNNGIDIWELSLFIPVDIYDSFDNITEIQGDIDRALADIVPSVSHSDFLSSRIRIDVLHDDDPDWRQKINQLLAGEGVTNQGRVRSDNVATKQVDGLLFRSKAEIAFYNFIKKMGIPFAPLPVFLKGGNDYRRVEPDFVVIKDGIMIIIEIDGDLYHKETPVQAQNRLGFLKLEGVELYRIDAQRCYKAADLEEAVDEFINYLNKLKENR